MVSHRRDGVIPWSKTCSSSQQPCPAFVQDPGDVGMAQLCVLCKQRQKGCFHPVSLNGHILPGYSLARLNTAGPGCFRAFLCTQDWTMAPVGLGWRQPHTFQPHTSQPHLQ